MNNLVAIMPKILARGLTSLREQAIYPRLVNGSFSTEAAMKGTTIDVPIPTAQAASDVTPSNTPPAPTSNVQLTVQISLDQWKKSNFFLNDKDMLEVDRNASFLPQQTMEAIRAIANVVNAQVASRYKGVFGYVGTAAATPFASSTAAATDARKTLNRQLCPRDSRRGVLDYDAEANALARPEFAALQETGDPDVKIEGVIGRKYGIDWYTDDNVPTHTAGTGTGYLVDNAPGPYALGTTNITVDTGTGTILKGDIVTFAGDTQTYAVQQDLAANLLVIYPGLKATLANNVAITVKATHVVNLVFHRDAIALANRPLVGSSQETALGSQIVSMTDPISQISMRLEVNRQYKQVVWELGPRQNSGFGVSIFRESLGTTPFLLRSLKPAHETGRFALKTNVTG